MRCFGRNFDGQLGLGDTEDRGDEARDTVDVKWILVFCYCQIKNASGCLVFYMNSYIPCLTVFDIKRKADKKRGVNFLALPPKAYLIPVSDTFTFICRLMLFLLLSSLVNGIMPKPGEMGDDLPTVDLGTDRYAVAITCGRWHTCALLDNGDVKVQPFVESA